MNLITGGTGLLGIHIMLELLVRGKSVRALKRVHSDQTPVKKIFEFYFPDKDYFSQIQWVDGDVLDTDSLLDAMSGCECIYHTAAIVSYHRSDRKQMYKVNVEGTANVVNCALEANVGKLCHISSIAAIGKAITGKVVNEDTEWIDSGANTHYGITKHEAELEVFRAVEEGLNAVIVCPGFIIGPGDFSRSSASLFTRLDAGIGYFPPGGTGFIAAADCARACVDLMAKTGVSGRYIAVTENKSMREIFQAVSSAIEKPVPQKEARRYHLEIARIAEWFKEKLTGSKALITKETIRNSSLTVVYDNSKIKSEIKFEPITIEKAIMQTAEYYRMIHPKK